MKKIILITLMAVVLTSCSSRKVQVFNNLAKNNTPSVESLNGTMYDVAVHFYDDKDRLVKTLTIGNIAPTESSDKLNAVKSAKHFKVEWGLVREGSELASVAPRITSGEYSEILRGVNVIEISTRSKATSSKPIF